MKIKVEPGKCQGHARCTTLAPDIFELDDDGYIAISEAEISPDQEAIARRAVRACPERALNLEEK